jgi:histidine triad (HIT) family protein
MFEDCIFKPIFQKFLTFISRLHIIKPTFCSLYISKTIKMQIIKTVIIIICFLPITMLSLAAQSEAYEKQKAAKLAVKSPFEKIVDRELPATIEYEDESIIVFVPLRKQAPVHLLIVPKKRIPTINDLTPEDEALVGKLFLVARKMAKEKGIADTGYRLAFNTNEHSGQSVFHIHLHLIGGKKLGPMVTQDYIDERKKQKN